MKTLIFIGLCIFSINLSNAQTGLYWSTPVAVANGATYDNNRPRIALVNDTIPVVIWGSSIGSDKAYFSKLTSGTFSTPVALNTGGQVNAYTVEGPNIAAKGDTVYAAYTLSSGYKSMIKASFDGGDTWLDEVWVDSLGSDFATFSNVAIGPGGNPYFSYIHTTSSWANARYGVHFSSNGGMTWNSEVIASDTSNGNEVCDCCVSDLKTYNGNPYLLYRNNNFNLRDMHAAFSLDSGMTFTKEYDMDTTDWIIPSCPSSGPEGGIIGDTLISVFMSKANSLYAKVYFSATSLNDTLTSYNEPIEPGFPDQGFQNYPVMDVKQDTIFSAWFANPITGGDIFLKYSVSGIAEFRNCPVYNASDAAAGNQNYPDLAFSHGKVHLVYSDLQTGNIMYRYAVIGPPVGMHENSIKELLTVGPNPASQNATITLKGLESGNYTVSIIDILGQEIMKPVPVSLTDPSIDPEIDQPGVYFLRIEKNNKFVSLVKLVIQ